MEPFVVLVAEAGLNLSPLTNKLWAERIPHRVVMDAQGQQNLLLANPSDSERVRFWVEQWRAGSIEHTEVQSPVASNRAAALLNLMASPFSALFLLLIAGMFFAQTQSDFWHPWLSLGHEYWPAERFHWQAYAAMGIWELWRPALLHFSLMHLVFNSLWWWILASKIERIEGVFPLLVLVFIGGLVGNIVQWWYMGPNFGGASGITMCLLGFIGVRLNSVPYRFPAMMLPIMVGIIVLTLATDSLFDGISHTAHGAHIGGLIIGLFMGWIWPKPQSQAQ